MSLVGSPAVWESMTCMRFICHLRRCLMNGCAICEWIERSSVYFILYTIFERLCEGPRRQVPWRSPAMLTLLVTTSPTGLARYHEEVRRPDTGFHAEESAAPGPDHAAKTTATDGHCSAISTRERVVRERSICAASLFELLLIHKWRSCLKNRLTHGFFSHTIISIGKIIKRSLLMADFFPRHWVRALRRAWTAQTICCGGM